MAYILYLEKQPKSSNAFYVQGHTIGHMMTGGGGGGNNQPAEAAPVQQYQPPAQQNYNNPCQADLDNFLECSKTQSDLSLCYGFNEALKECRLRFGMYNLQVLCCLSIKSACE